MARASLLKKRSFHFLTRKTRFTNVSINTRDGPQFQQSTSRRATLMRRRHTRQRAPTRHLWQKFSGSIEQALERQFWKFSFTDGGT
ncbi:hypothetical protein, partial [Halomonas cupida]|uniref:hypothetical protein n=1 Tax=Halomonas cupida TaxID=44933 RepID=UPI001C3FDB9C